MSPWTSAKSGPKLLAGSHLESQNYAGWLDGPLGVVYATDAKAESAVRIVAAFPATSHAPIRYPAAKTARGRAEALGYLTYLNGADAVITWKKFGFLELSQ